MAQQQYAAYVSLVPYSQKKTPKTKKKNKKTTEWINENYPDPTRYIVIFTAMARHDMNTPPDQVIIPGNLFYSAHRG